jgi:hypothetical protein
VITQVYILQRFEDHSADHVCEHCNSIVEWTPWDGTTALGSGHYCLTGDIALEETIALKKVDTVLFLNGYNITSKKRKKYKHHKKERTRIWILLPLSSLWTG